MPHNITHACRPQWRLHRWLPGLLLPLILSNLVAAAERPSPPAVDVSKAINFEDGQLSARLVAAPLPHVMEELSRRCRMQIQWMDPKPNQSVSVEFTALPLAEAVERILEGNNFMLFYASGGGAQRLTKIWIGSQTAEGDAVASPPNPEGGARNTMPRSGEESKASDTPEASGRETPNAANVPFLMNEDLAQEEAESPQVQVEAPAWTEQAP